MFEKKWNKLFLTYFQNQEKKFCKFNLVLEKNHTSYIWKWIISIATPLPPPLDAPYRMWEQLFIQGFYFYLYA